MTASVSAFSGESTACHTRPTRLTRGRGCLILRRSSMADETTGPITTKLKKELEAQGLKVNILESRPTLLEHLADVQGHRCLVSGDSLPMHLALGSGVRCVSIFTCTSPWEIHGYELQEKIVSPLLEKFFYKRGYDRNATTAIRLGVKDAVMAQLDAQVVSVD